MCVCVCIYVCVCVYTYIHTHTIHTGLDIKYYHMVVLQTSKFVIYLSEYKCYLPIDFFFYCSYIKHI